MNECKRASHSNFLGAFLRASGSHDWMGYRYYYCLGKLFKGAILTQVRSSGNIRSVILLGSALLGDIPCHIRAVKSVPRTPYTTR